MAAVGPQEVIRNTFSYVCLGVINCQDGFSAQFRYPTHREVDIGLVYVS